MPDINKVTESRRRCRENTTDPHMRTALALEQIADSLEACDSRTSGLMADWRGYWAGFKPLYRRALRTIETLVSRDVDTGPLWGIQVNQRSIAGRERY